MGRALALLLLAPAVSGCQVPVPVRMDYPDRVFEPTSSRPTPLGPLVAMEMMLSLATQMAAMDRGRQPNAVRAMEPIPNPGDHATVVADRSRQPAAARAMEPIWNPEGYATATGRSRQPGVAAAMEPIPNPGDQAAAPHRGSRMASARTTEPRPDPVPSPALDGEAHTRSLVRQHPWTTRFWMELTPAERARVERQLRRGKARPAGEQAEPAAIWDSMGLADRVGMVFGKGRAFEAPPPAERRDGSTLAGSS